MNKKNNQLKNSMIKTIEHPDEVENVELGQFLRDTFLNIKVEREWYIVFTQENKFVRVQAKQPERGINYRHPDIMIFDKLPGNKRGSLICCMENDGSIHRQKVVDDDERNQQYADANIELLVIQKERLGVSIFDEAYRLLTDLFEAQK